LVCVRRVVEAYFTKLRDYLATQKPTAAITTPTKALPAAAKKPAPAKKAKPAAKAKTAKPATGKKVAAKPKATYESAIPALT
jgi:hypothetical protein